jgi:hypothetical protein
LAAGLDLPRSWPTFAMSMGDRERVVCALGALLRFGDNPGTRSRPRVAAGADCRGVLRGALALGAFCRGALARGALLPEADLALPELRDEPLVDPLLRDAPELLLPPLDAAAACEFPISQDVGKTGQAIMMANAIDSPAHRRFLCRHPGMTHLQTNRTAAAEGTAGRPLHI